MKNIFLKQTTKYDWILIILILLISIFLFFIPAFGLGSFFDSDIETNKTVVIKSESGIEKISLDKSYAEKPLIIEVKGPIGVNRVAVHSGEVWMEEAPDEDPHKLCKKIGVIDSVGPRLACVPNNVVVWIEKDE